MAPPQSGDAFERIKCFRWLLSILNLLIIEMGEERGARDPYENRLALQVKSAGQGSRRQVDESTLSALLLLPASIIEDTT